MLRTHLIGDDAAAKLEEAMRRRGAMTTAPNPNFQIVSNQYRCECSCPERRRRRRV